VTTVIPLSPGTHLRLRALFRQEDLAEAEALLEEQCADGLPFGESMTPADLERIRFAAIRVSDGRLSELREAIALANVDWRDLLVGAGFAHDVRAHEEWMPRQR